MPDLRSPVTKWVILPLLGLGAVVLILGSLFWLVDPFSRWHRFQFPFPHSGGPGEAMVFSILPSGDLAKHEACVISAYPDPLRREGINYWVRPLAGDSALEQQARETPFLFYELDVGSGVAGFCVHEISDPELAKRVAAEMARQCQGLAGLSQESPRDASRLLALSGALKDFSGTPCQEPAGLTYELVEF